MLARTWLLLAGAACLVALCIHCAVQDASCAGRFSGLASYYSNGESGVRTASGARFVDRLPTAAYRCLPFGSRLRLRYAGRMLDLAWAQATALGMLGADVAHVEAEVVD